MPSKIKSKLLIVTVFCATLAILFLIAPATAEMYSLILLGVSLLMATLAGFNARETVELQYKVSSFITLAVFIFVGIFDYWGIIWAEPVAWILMVIPLVLKTFRNREIFPQKTTSKRN